MAYGGLAADSVQSSTANTPPKFYDGNSAEIGTLCRAWVNFNGVTTATIRASFNVSSVTRNSVGDYTVNFTNALPDANYAVAGIADNSTSSLGANGSVSVELKSGVAPTTSACAFQVHRSAVAFVDTPYVFATFFR